MGDDRNRTTSGPAAHASRSTPAADRDRCPPDLPRAARDRRARRDGRGGPTGAGQS